MIGFSFVLMMESEKIYVELWKIIADSFDLMWFSEICILVELYLKKNLMLIEF